MSPGRIRLSKPDDYIEILRSNYVLIDPKERKKHVVRGIDKAAGDCGGKVLQDDDLVDIVTNLVEYPAVVAGNFDKEFELLSDNDVLGNSLLEMRESLNLANKQEDVRKLEDQKQNWATQGIAKFGEILRQNTEDMQEFSYHIISNLVKYIEGNQGGIFIVNDDDKNDIFNMLYFESFDK